MSLAGIILAAGSSERMGWPKALLEVGGETFAGRLIRAFSPWLAPIVVVLGAGAETIRADIRRAGDVEFVVNPDFELGQLSSLQRALHALPADIDGFLFTPVDCPMVESETVRRLVEAHRQHCPPHLLVIPCAGGRRGHPVCCDRRLLAEFLSLPPAAQARDVVHRHRDHTLYLDVEDPGILDDVDTPEDHKRLLAAFRQA